MTTKINGTNTAANPAITGADTDTGLSFGTDTVNINTGGTTKATVESNGRLGIGTTNPVSILHLHEAGASGSPVIQFSNGDTGTTSGDGFAIGVADNESPFIYNRENTALRFATNNNEGMRLGSDGKLLVGRSSSITVAGDPSDHNFEQLSNNGGAVALHCNQQYKRGLMIYYPSTSGASDFIRCQISSSAKFLVTGNGNTQNANNSYGSISDASLKENIVDANSQWDDIKNIRVRNYNFKESTGQPTHTQIGVVAQELETVSPKLVEVSDKDGIKNVQYSVLYMKAVKALQEAMTRIETLETKVATLEAA